MQTASARLNDQERVRQRGASVNERARQLGGWRDMENPGY